MISSDISGIIFAAISNFICLELPLKKLNLKTGIEVYLSLALGIIIFLRYNRSSDRLTSSQIEIFFIGETVLVPVQPTHSSLILPQDLEKPVRLHHLEKNSPKTQTDIPGKDKTQTESQLTFTSESVVKSSSIITQSTNQEISPTTTSKSVSSNCKIITEELPKSEMNTLEALSALAVMAIPQDESITNTTIDSNNNYNNNTNSRDFLTDSQPSDEVVNALVSINQKNPSANNNNPKINKTDSIVDNSNISNEIAMVTSNNANTSNSIIDTSTYVNSTTVIPEKIPSPKKDTKPRPKRAKVVGNAPPMVATTPEKSYAVPPSNEKIVITLVPKSQNSLSPKKDPVTAPTPVLATVPAVSTAAQPEPEKKVSMVFGNTKRVRISLFLYYN